MNDFAAAVQTLADLIAEVGLVAVILAVAMLLVGLPVVTFAVAFAAKKGGKLADVPLVKANQGVCRWVADRIVVGAAMMRHRGYSTV